jgi:hypothetical protein
VDAVGLGGLLALAQLLDLGLGLDPLRLGRALRGQPLRGSLGPLVPFGASLNHTATPRLRIFLRSAIVL